VLFGKLGDRYARNVDTVDHYVCGIYDDDALIANLTVYAANREGIAFIIGPQLGAWGAFSLRPSDKRKASRRKDLSYFILAHESAPACSAATA
jgi:hypothetical protein